MEIDSAYLCRNIDWAFKVWQEQPWGKNISFETFCEFYKEMQGQEMSEQDQKILREILSERKGEDG